MIYLAFALFLSIFGGISYYIGLRAWQWLGSFAALVIPRPVFWGALWVLAFSLPLARLRWLPLGVTELLAKIGGYWMALFVYVLPALLLIDIVRLLNRWLGPVPARWMPDVNLVRVTGTAVCVLFLGLMIYGTWNARTPVVTEYALTIPKSAGALQQLHVVMISDTHLGSILGNGRIREMVSMVNQLEPDLILLAGDIIDDDPRPFLAHDMPTELSKMKARLGTYGVLGNHDTGFEALAEFREMMDRSGIYLLVDEWVKVADSFYVVGRNDSSQRAVRSGQEKALEKILAGTDPALPIFLMDHQPNRLEDAAAAGVDLQVSGHTHRGQLFPGNLITSRIFEVDWGYLLKGSTHVVVSNGFGTWGPPVRIGNRPEVVSIRLTFTD